MTRSHRLIAGIGLAAAAAVFSLISIRVNADREEIKKISAAERRTLIGLKTADISTAEKASILRASKRVIAVSHTLVYQTFNGPISKLDEFLAEFYKSFNDQDLGTGLASDKTPMAIVYSNPDTNESVRIDIGYAVSRRARVKAPLAVRTLKLNKAVVHIHKGAYGKISAVHREIRKDLKSDASEPGFPTILRLLSDPSKVSSPEDITTEVVVPAAKVEMP